MKTNADSIIKKLKSLSDPRAVEGMARFGINPEKTLGVSIPALRKLAKETGGDHEIANRLWKSGIHEARVLASMIDDPEKVTEKQMEDWVKDFDSWDVCDQVSMNLFGETKFAYKKAAEWTKRNEEFVRRAGFAMIAVLAWQDKKEDRDGKLAKFFPLIKKYSIDDRNFVKKAVNWALRNIGKRNLSMNKKAVETAREISKIDSKSAKWIASDAIRELTGKAVLGRLNKLKK